MKIGQILCNAGVKFTLSGSNVIAGFSLPSDLWSVKADKGQLSQVIGNLTINAIQAMPEGGKLTIEAENTTDIDSSLSANVSGTFVKFSVRDEGVGILAKHLEKIFDPYFTTKQAGRGLGLASVHSIVAKHNGHIFSDSELGIGTTFTIYLPAETSTQQTINADSSSTTEKSTRKSGRILIMDDDEAIRTLSVEILEPLGYTVDTVADGDEAVELYVNAMKSGNPFDVAILDLTIPGAKGGQATKTELLTIDPQAKLIVTSGYSTDSIMAKYHEFGFKGRLAKPYRMRELKNEISRVMEKE